MYENGGSAASPAASAAVDAKLRRTAAPEKLVWLRSTSSTCSEPSRKLAKASPVGRSGASKSCTARLARARARPPRPASLPPPKPHLAPPRARAPSPPPAPPGPRQLPSATSLLLQRRQPRGLLPSPPPSASFIRELFYFVPFVTMHWEGEPRGSGAWGNEVESHGPRPARARITIICRRGLAIKFRNALPYPLIPPGVFPESGNAGRIGPSPYVADACTGNPPGPLSPQYIHKLGHDVVAVDVAAAGAHPG